jgi:hypothetical protein
MDIILSLAAFQAERRISHILPATWSRPFASSRIAVGSFMKFIHFVLIFSCALAIGVAELRAQQSKPEDASSNSGQPSSSREQSSQQGETPQSYSGTYTFLKEGEFVQVTVEDDNRVTGFVSRFGDSEGDKGEFLDQFFKSGKVDGNKLTFTTQIVHGTAFDFKGSVERGAGKGPGDESYYVLKGTLITSTTDANKKVTSQSQEVAFKLFPKDAAPPR